MSIELAKMVIGSTHGYWLVSRENERRDGGQWVTDSPTTWVISIPHSPKYRRGVQYDDMLVSEIEGILNTELPTNISISEDYPPFQQGIYFKDFIGGVQILVNIKEAVKMLLQMEKSDFYTYKTALKDFQAVNGI